MKGGGENHSAAEDLDTARLVGRFQAGDREAYATLYTRYFDRVYAYLRVIFEQEHDAEDAAQEVFLKVLEALPRYQLRKQPFRAWLFVIARNHAVSEVKKMHRLDLVEPAELDRLREDLADDGADLSALGWLSDSDLMTFIERLQVPQRQVLVLRYLIDLPTKEVARILGRSQSDVSVMQSRAVLFLRERLTALGHGPKRRADPAQALRPTKKAHTTRRRRFALDAPGTRRPWQDRRG